MMVAGPTQSGKTTFVSNLLHDRHIYYTEEPNKIYYYYNVCQPEDQKLNVNVYSFVSGIPTMETLKEMYDTHGANTTLVVDDQALHVSDDTAEMFSVGCSRYKVNIIFITQNLFGHHKSCRDLSKNSMYVVLMRNPRENRSASTFFHQQPENASDLKEAYQDACKRPYSYLLCDFHQQTPNTLRYWSNLFGATTSDFPDDFPTLYLIGKERSLKTAKP